MQTTPKKLFVGGVSRETTEAHMRDYFTRFGEIEDCVIIHDRDTGRSKGFGFVSFTEPSMAEQALSQPHHVILERKVDVKPARPRGQLEQDQEQDSNDNGEPSRVKKIFVGGLPDGLTVGELRNYFEGYGSIEDAVVMHDGDGKPRGFGFVTFESEDAATHVLHQTFHRLKSKTVEVKRAEPKERLAYQKCLHPWLSFGPCVYYPLPIPFYPYGFNICFGEQYYTQDSNSSSKPRSVDVDNPSCSSSINGDSDIVNGLSDHSVQEFIHSDRNEIMNELSFVDMVTTSEKGERGREAEFLDYDEGNQTEINESGSVGNESSSSSNDSDIVDFASANLNTDSTMRKMSMIRPLN